MRFGLVHRVMTDALAALGVLSLVTSGQFSRPLSIAVLIGLTLGIAMKESWRHRAASRHLDTILVFILVAVQLGRTVLIGASVLDALIEFAVGLQIIRVATRKGAAHDQQVIVLALLHLIAGTVVGGGLGYGLCFFGLLVVTPGALVLSHLRREVEGNYRQGARDRTGLPVDVPRILRSKRVVGRQFIAVTCLLSIPILLFTVILFVVFPRVGLSLLLLNRSKSGRMIGFSGKVDLGQIGTLRRDETIALRVTIDKPGTPPPPRLLMHLRGTALDHYDGRSWTQSTKLARTVANGAELVKLRGQPRPAADPSWQIELEPIDPPVLFVPPYATGLRLLRGHAVGRPSTVSIQRGPEGELRYQSAADRGAHYEVFLSPDGVTSARPLSAAARARYLQLPTGLPDRIGKLAAQWTANKEDPQQRARALEKQLRTGYRYDLSSPSGKHDRPLDHFLFESKRGHCEYYSTAMAVMLRTMDIPSRNVTGFVGGTYNRYGKFYAVRQGDAHSWVEAYIAGRGWLTFDPTPPGAAIPQSEIDGMLASARDFFEAVSQRWNRHVLGYDLRQQVSLLESLGPNERRFRNLLRTPSRRALIIGAGVLLALFSLLWWLRRRRRQAQQGGRLPNTRQAKSEVIATHLYQTLDSAMQQLGIARADTVPPLRHATALGDRDHPLAAAVLTLTQRYQEARFGCKPLSSADRRDFELKVRQLKEANADGPTSARRLPRTEPSQKGPKSAATTQAPAAPESSNDSDRPSERAPQNEKDD